MTGAAIVYGALKATVGLRLDAEEEFNGADLTHPQDQRDGGTGGTAGGRAGRVRDAPARLAGIARVSRTCAGRR